MAVMCGLITFVCIIGLVALNVRDRWLAEDLADRLVNAERLAARLAAERDELERRIERLESLDRTF